ncbi:hypothetical protein ACFE04_023808 [Oxalis oulophora]
MECSGGSRGCVGPARRRCNRCNAVAYCSASHQALHWNEHKKECERLSQQMTRVHELNHFPFTFTKQSTLLVCEKKGTRCSFLSKRGIHKRGMWTVECNCRVFDAGPRSMIDYGWDLESLLCPCREPVSAMSKCLNTWEDYYEWRGIPLHSPVAILLQWPLTIYHATQFAGLRSSGYEICDELYIHYLGPEKELSQLDVFGELIALFPGVQVHIEFVGPAVPENRNGEEINISNYARCNDTHCSCKSSNETMRQFQKDGRTSAVQLRVRRGLYHELYNDITKYSFPDLVIAPNAGLAAYPSWLPTIELLKEIDVPTVFSDYCEEACNLSSDCVNSVTGCRFKIPIQLNPFRQPMAVEDSPLLIPCYSNCFLFVSSSTSFNFTFPNISGIPPISIRNATKSSWNAFEKFSGCHTGQTVDGLSKLKQYLNHFGYIHDHKSFTDDFDDALESALKVYQKNFNLNQTGQLDKATIKQIQKPRCGNADVINGTSTMNLGKTSTGHLHNVGHYSFFRGQPRWSKDELTYAFSPENRLSNEVKAVFARAFTRWSKALDYY